MSISLDNLIRIKAPQLIPYILHSEDADKYTVGSNQLIKWKCPNCGFEFTLSPNKMIQRKKYCQACSDSCSFGEKVLRTYLSLLYIPYEQHCVFPWSDRKEYDFYIPFRNTIIETHGRQHYENTGFSKLSGKTLDDEQYNDLYKKELALKNGISHYIEIDCRQSDFKYIYNSIINSNLPELLFVLSDDININEIASNIIDNRIIQVCNLFMSGIKDLRIIAEEVGCSYNTVKSDLQKGAVIELCDYDPQERIIQARHDNSKRVIETMSKPVLQINESGDVVSEYPSIQEAQRRLGISHIWDVIVGRRNTAGGYRWQYK